MTEQQTENVTTAIINLIAAGTPQHLIHDALLTFTGTDVLKIYVSLKQRRGQ